MDRLGEIVLIEELGGVIDVVVCPSIWTANDHDSDIVVVDAVIVDGRLEEV